MSRIATCAAAFVMLVGLAMTGTHSAAAADLSSWKREIAMVIAKKQVYPRSALMREIEGSAKVKVTVDASGKIVNYEIIEPTGEDVLDREIPRLIERIDPLPKPPADANADELTFIIPLAWRLQ
ncbi:MAG: hypothetical protein KatS3mg119_2044 [Rhodothalassiaceae bacterium]|nr:MAG: hypothetical protein KatS3mg119_2044 [Rhodothalassiaceae bacterium]